MDIDVFILNLSEAFSACLMCQYVGIGSITLRKGNIKEVRESQHLAVCV